MYILCRMSVLPLLSLLVGCQRRELLDQNAALQQQVAALEASNAAMAQDMEAMRAQLIRLQREHPERGSPPNSAPAPAVVARITTGYGTINCRLRADEAPDTVANFIGLARGERAWTDPRTREEVRRPLYDGLTFHRVMPGFMIQGGDPLGTGAGGPGYTFADEIGPQTVFDRPGLLAMANAGPNTNGSQFFITEAPAPQLNGRHTIFGDCDGIDVVKKIARVPVRGTKPVEPVTMNIRME